LDRPGPSAAYADTEFVADTIVVMDADYNAEMIEQIAFPRATGLVRVRR
jgi:hypothetical protein